MAQFGAGCAVEGDGDAGGAQDAFHDDGEVEAAELAWPLAELLVAAFDEGVVQYGDVVLELLAGFKRSSREHTESDLRCYLAWCAERGLDPLTAKRPHLELYIRSMQEIRRFKPSTDPAWSPRSSTGSPSTPTSSKPAPSPTGSAPARPPAAAKDPAEAGAKIHADQWGQNT